MKDRDFNLPLVSISLTMSKLPRVLPKPSFPASNETGLAVPIEALLVFSILNKNEFAP